MAIVFKWGIILLLVSLGLWVYEHEFENTLPFTPALDVWCAAAGAILIAVFLMVYAYSLLFGVSSKWRRAGRCVRCGIRIPKNEMYCDFHKKEVASDFLRHTSQNGDSQR
ncbi:hypothetical protein JXA80_06175 [bacterium]|nr:hypothetical protein [candidate division CSSED10-310 bacterium]